MAWRQGAVCDQWAASYFQMCAVRMFLASLELSAGAAGATGGRQSRLEFFNSWMRYEIWRDRWQWGQWTRCGSNRQVAEEFQQKQKRAQDWRSWILQVRYFLLLCVNFCKRLFYVWITFRCVCKTPPTTAKLAERPRWLPPGYKVSRLKELSLGNPVFGFRMQLFCRTGFHLAIFPDTKVRGVKEDRHDNGSYIFVSTLCKYLEHYYVIFIYFLQLWSSSVLLTSVRCALEGSQVICTWLWTKMGDFMGKWVKAMSILILKLKQIPRDQLHSISGKNRHFLTSGF